MKGRVALSDPEIARTIKQNYVAAVGQHERLTREPLSDWWLPVVKSLNPNYAGATTQGYYILRPDGSGIMADNFPPRLKTFLERGLVQFRQGARTTAHVTAEDVRQFAPPPMPDGASVVRLYTRAKLADGTAAPGTYLNRDVMWILRREVEEILASADKSAGDFALPRTLVARLTTFHLVDGTRGQVWPYQPQSVSRASFTARPVRRAASGTVRTFTLFGDYAKRDSHPPQWDERGQEGRFEGEFDIDISTKMITRFRAYADSAAWSNASYDRNAPPPTGRYKLLTAIVEATDELAQQVPPEPSFTGNHYLRTQLPAR